VVVGERGERGGSRRRCRLSFGVSIVDEVLMGWESGADVFLVCGGGFQEGGGHAPYQVPDHWVQRTQTHIVVTFK
jgi:hypothetical protein